MSLEKATRGHTRRLKDESLGRQMILILRGKKWSMKSYNGGGEGMQRKVSRKTCQGFVQIEVVIKERN